jgi:hypothetical protein
MNDIFLISHLQMKWFYTQLHDYLMLMIDQPPYFLMRSKDYTSPISQLFNQLLLSMVINHYYLSVLYIGLKTRVIQELMVVNELVMESHQLVLLWKEDQAVEVFESGQ